MTFTREDRAWTLKGLRTAVERLAADSDSQVRWLEETGAHPDELGLELDQFLPPAKQTLLAEFSPETMSKLLELDAAILQFSGPDNVFLWSSHAIRTAPAWQDVRVLALQALGAGRWPDA